MSYISASDLIGLVPMPNLVNGLDDNGDGEIDADVLAAVISHAEDRVNAPLEGRYPVPFAPPLPATIKRAALVFAAWEVYARRGLRGKDNPHEKDAADFDAILAEIGEGKRPLSPAAATVPSAGGVIVEEPSATARKPGTTNYA